MPGKDVGPNACSWQGCSTRTKDAVLMDIAGEGIVLTLGAEDNVRHSSKVEGLLGKIQECWFRKIDSTINRCYTLSGQNFPPGTPGSCKLLQAH